MLFYTFYTNADSWAMKKANRHLYSSGTLSVAGSIKDETGAVLSLIHIYIMLPEVSVM